MQRGLKWRLKSISSPDFNTKDSVWNPKFKKKRKTNNKIHVEKKILTDSWLFFQFLLILGFSTGFWLFSSKPFRERPIILFRRNFQSNSKGWNKSTNLSLRTKKKKKLTKFNSKTVKLLQIFKVIKKFWMI